MEGIVRIEYNPDVFSFGIIYISEEATISGKEFNKMSQDIGNRVGKNPDYFAQDLWEFEFTHSKKGWVLDSYCKRGENY